MATKNSSAQIQRLFDPQRFREQGEQIIARLETYLADGSIRGLDIQDPHQLMAAARTLMKGNDETPLPEKILSQRLEQIIDLYIKTGIQVHSPGYMGRQFSGVLPLAGAVDMIASVANQPASFYEAGQLPNVAEKIMADELSAFIGWQPGTFEMVTTSGGSLANLTAILAARNHAFPGIWSTGTSALKGNTIPAIAVSEDVHYSISRAAGILGIGADHIIKLPINPARQIDIDKVEATLEEARARGLTVFCIVGSAGSTAVGAVVLYSTGWVSSRVKYVVLAS